MEKRLKMLLWSLALPAILITALGVYLKYWVLGEEDRYRDKAAAALPFALLTDAEMREYLTKPQPTALQLELPEAMPVADVLPEPTDPPETEPPETLPPKTVPPETTVPETIPPYTWEIGATEDGKPRFSFEGPRVEDGWFADVLFIGDSRTCTLRDLARSGEADYFCDVGMSVFNIWNKGCEDRHYGYQTLSGLLEAGSYGKIFISLGLNEAGYGLDELLEKYGELIAFVQEKQPTAEIILQGIMTVSYRKANSAWHFRISNLQRINEGIAAMADGEQIHFIDVNEIFADEEGYLRSGISGDGCHLYGKYGVVWEEWIRHASAQLGIE